MKTFSEYRLRQVTHLANGLTESTPIGQALNESQLIMLKEHARSYTERGFDVKILKTTKTTEEIEF
jgi:hypothetical protein